MTKYTYDEWMAEGTRRFGPDQMQWKFICPCCKHVAAPGDWRDAGLPGSMVAFSCIGRGMSATREAFTDARKSTQPGPCNYAGGGLFRLNPVVVTDTNGAEHQMFDFAPELGDGSAA